MDTLREKLASAIKLCKSENHEETRHFLLELHTEFPEELQINYGSLFPCAWIHDLLGLEREAIPFYEKAIQTGVSGSDLKSALLGMGSTYRCIGENHKSIEIFQHALNLFPDSREFKVFLGMAYYNIGEFSKAMELLLNNLADTFNDESTLRYPRTIRFYSDKLDQTW